MIYFVFSTWLLVLYLNSRSVQGKAGDSPKSTPTAFCVQMLAILTLLFSKDYWPEAESTDRLRTLEHLLGLLAILGLSCNLVWMYLRLFYRYEQLASLTVDHQKQDAKDLPLRV